MATYSASTVSTHPSYSWIDGLVGGLIGGIVQGVVGMMGTLIMGQGLFWPLVLIGYAFRPATNNPSQDMGTILFGVLYHMVFTMMLGLVFALIASHLPKVLPLWVWGILYAVMIWVIDFLGALNIVNPTMASLMNPWLFLVTHLAYGAVLGWYVGSRANRTVNA